MISQKIKKILKIRIKAKGIALIYLLSIMIIVFIPWKSVLAQASSYIELDNATGKYMKISVDDEGVQHKQEVSKWQAAADSLKSLNFQQFAQIVWHEAGSKALQAAVQTALRSIAMDTATWIGSGGKGQKPMFITDGWGTYLGNIGDQAAGQFIETLGKNWNLNLCQPNDLVKMKIGLGLIQYARPAAPACTFTQMKKNWSQELKRQDFLGRFQDMFNPTSNDIGMALTLQTTLLGQIDLNKYLGQLYRQEGKGWLSVETLISGKVTQPPNDAQRRLQQVSDLQTYHFGDFTGSALIDAANVFLNQLAITLFNNLMSKIGQGKTFTSPYGGNFAGLFNYNAAPTNEGAKGVRDRLNALAQPDFSVRGDYNILAELTTCPDPAKAGPTNCVIDEKFRQAIENKLTVGQALEQGYLNANGAFGFISNEKEPSYNEGYPYRSMMILRKFRIIPASWEVAAEYIKDHPEKESADSNGGSGGMRTMADLVSCFDPCDQYSGYGDGTTDSSGHCNPPTPDQYAWCRSLVDPNWVLKAPLNYCKRQGPGPEIVTQQVIGQGSGSQLAVSRDDKYCADEQTCVLENSDGSCKVTTNSYGYCTEERRKWNFKSDSCDPKYNTCQAFTGLSGQNIAYLENSLDYTNCSAEVAGCKQYAATGVYSAKDDSVGWSVAVADQRYFNRQVQTCDQSAEGCHQLIRTNADSGTNLIRNSSFEQPWVDEQTNIMSADSLTAVIGGTATKFDFWNDLSNLGQATTTAYDGRIGLWLKANASFSYDMPVGPVKDKDGVVYSPAGDKFSLSFYSRNCGLTADDTFQITDLGPAIALMPGDYWQKNETNLVLPGDYQGNTVKINIKSSSSSCVIDAIKLERIAVDGSATSYSGYGQNGVIYEKVMPDYLKDICNTALPPAICDKYAQKCSANNVGCDSYTSITNNLSVNAKVTADDYCKAECVGYNTFVQAPTYFDSQRDAYFIPKTARSCSADASGCDQFTNLDQAKKGGEGIEYYSDLRQCVKPSEAGSGCAEFYTWEGTDESGYQLKVMQLKQGDGNPFVADNDQKDCNADIYKLPAHDTDCRQFYNRAGQISYHLYSRTVSCTEDCHPYRRTEKNIDPQLDQAGCGSGVFCADSASNGLDKCWDGANNACVVCRNGGQWDNSSQSCLYLAVPGQGLSCSADQNGCRTYGGNISNNLMFVFNYDFETKDTQSWRGLNDTAVTNSNTAQIAGQHSLAISGGNDTASVAVGQVVQAGKSYVLTFTAKAKNQSAAPQVSAVLDNGNGSTTPFSAVKLSDGWLSYNISLDNLNHQVTDGEILILSGNGDFYIDNIRLSEVTDLYYLIKDSWKTPAVCDQDWSGNPYPLFMLGCDAYHDSRQNTHYLHSFTHQCTGNKAGCELMIDTKNSASAADDNFDFVVYDANKQCNQSDKGCQRLGQQYVYQGNNLFKDVYLKNDPDQYSSIQCSKENVGCDEWTTADQGSRYFKDPGDQACEWRQKAGESGGWGWYMKKIKRCDINNDGKISDQEKNDICLADTDCKSYGSNIKCIQDAADYPCPTDSSKTIGVGGAGNAVYQPTGDLSGQWAGICPAEQSGCSEYIDPVSQFSGNMIFNADFSQQVDPKAKYADGWDNQTQEVNLEPNTLYILAVTGNNTASIFTNDANFRRLDSDNVLDPATSKITVPAAGARQSERFYTDSNIGLKTVTIQADNAASANNGSKIELKKAVLDYQLAQNLDKTSCNGVVNFNQGCVLFNERAWATSSSMNLKYNADLIANDGKGASPQVGAPATNNANALIKASPDRTCNKWLACSSYLKDEQGNTTCFDIGLCDKIDDNGNCISFVTNKAGVNQIYGGNNSTVDLAKLNNLSGYSLVGSDGSSLKTDYYGFGDMKQIGEVANLANGGFEEAGTNGYPVGWTYEGGSGYNITVSSPAYSGQATTTSASWNANIFKVITNPIDAQTEGVGYAPEGRNFLKLGAGFNAVSEAIDVAPGTEYVITAYVNTKNLHSGQAKIAVKADDVDINAADIAADVTAASNNWTFKLFNFKPTAATQVRIWLYGIKNNPSQTEDPQGSLYFDGIIVRPALNSKTNLAVTPNSPWYTNQTCRLYPQTDSLSCSYFDDSGKRQKGWYGYCLQYDRKPGDPNACLLWYPLDKVLGDGVEEGAGYQDRTPLYYCADFPGGVLVEARQAVGMDGINIDGGCTCVCTSVPVDGNLSNCEGNCPGGFPAGYIQSGDIGGGGGVAGCGNCPQGKIYPGGCDTGYNSWYKLKPNPNDYVGSDKGYNWYYYDGSLEKFSGHAQRYGIPSLPNSWDESNPGLGLWDSKTNTVTILSSANFPCSQVVQTVTPTGQNKFWSGKVYQGSKVTADPLGYSYLTPVEPFGAVMPPAPVNNPYEWDGAANNNTNQNNLPLYLENFSNQADYLSQANAGSPYGCIGDCSKIGLCETSKKLCYDQGSNTTQNPNNTYVCATGEKCITPFPVTDTGITHNGVDIIKRLFAQSYGSWTWQPTDNTKPYADGRYIRDDKNRWGPPGTNNELNGGRCEDQNSNLLTSRPAYPNDYCAILPRVNNIKVNDALDTNVEIKNQFINLKFNSTVDSQQLPMVAYKVDWGDGQQTVVSGVEMRDQPNELNPHSLYHLYSYWDLKAKTVSNVGKIQCAGAGGTIANGPTCPSDSNCCAIQPRVQVKDNWGWCNQGTEAINNLKINGCTDSQWEPFNNWVVVREK